MKTLTPAQLEDAFGHFDFDEDHSRGRRGWIIPDPTWAEANVIIITPPFALRTAGGQPIKKIACHRLVAPDLRSILDELLAQRLQHLIVTWDGCWAARHQRNDPNNPLSVHSWAGAVDLNSAAYPLGSHRKQDTRLVAMFTKRGWIAGQTFHSPDPMHFEVGPRWVEMHAPGAAAPSGNSSGNNPGGEAAPPTPPHDPPSSSADAPITVYVDGKPLPPGRLIAGSVYVPARAVAKALGATVAYDSATRTVRITRP